jgi:outer membrane protein
MRRGQPLKRYRKRDRVQRSASYSWRAGIALGLALAALPGLATAQAGNDGTQTPPQQTGTPQSMPTGVTPLPSAPPPTGLQAKLPAAQRQLPRPDKPTLVSPTLTDLYGRAPVGPIDIQQAVAIALGNSRSLEQANEALLQARGRTSEVRAGFNPTLGGSFTYTRLNTGQSATFSNGNQTENIPLVNADQPVLSATATLPIDISGQIRAATDQAHFNEVAARIDVNRTRNQVVSDVKTAFYNVLRAQALVVVAQETLQDDLDRLSDAQKKLNAGTVAPFDVLRAQTDVANAQQQLITARSNVSLEIATLNNVLGVNIDAPTQVTDRDAVQDPPGVAPPTVAPNSPNGAPAQPSAPAPAQSAAPAGGQGANTNAAAVTLDLGADYAAVVREALLNRPEVLESDAQLAAARQGIRIALRGHLPSLALSAGVTYSPNQAGFSPQTTSGQFVLSLTMPIFDGDVTRGRLVQARALVAQAETARRQNVDLVNLDVRSAYLTLLQARDRVAVANQALAEAQESYRLARVRYTNGISTLVEVSDAQAALTQAENNQVNALYDYNNARSTLDKAAGRYSYVANGPGYAAPPTARVTGNPSADIRTGGRP